MKKDEGFTLVEIIVVVVVLALLVLGVTFTFQSIVKQNHISARRDKANALSTTILDQMSNLSFADIKEDTVLSFLQFPSYIDSEHVAISDFDYDSSIETKCFKIDGLSDKLYDLRLEFDLNTSDYTLDYNTVKLPLFEYLSNNDTFVINDNVETTVFAKKADGSYMVSDELTRKFVDSVDGSNSYDFQVVQKFILKNKTKLVRRYEEWEALEANMGVAYEDSPFYSLELSEEDVYKCLDKTTTLDITTNPSGVQKIVTDTIVYRLNLDCINDLGGYYESITDVSELFDGDPYETIYVSSTRYFNLSNLYILYWGTQCHSDTCIIENVADIPLNIFLVIENQYNAQEIIDGKFDCFAAVSKPSNFKIQYRQSAATIDMSQFYTNCEDRNVIVSPVLVSNIHTASDDNRGVMTVRLYDVRLVVYDNQGHMLSDMTRNILSK